MILGVYYRYSPDLYIEALFTASKNEGGDKMQTIKITITTPTPVNVVVKECTPEKSSADEKLAKLLKKLQEVQ
ncbi:hypothetical protein SBF1_1050003 [Candidatus Desulfosporosinus infrequens]|uniref:Uncharacterized protein n=1 Tax=Candidatus Desulfosporosinus infrequens TaxID=2043169 RepID=A0A2U3JX03_9FIRM|nr:hypothetical protein SBF1_1050003 [Candidatus Desulfosporosinus infrequens]